jgi:hypothetical protein
VPFDFPVQPLVEKALGATGKGVEVLNQPLTFQASVSAVEGEKEKGNNGSEFSLHAGLQRRKALILDGRPRWETRYLRNLLDRDEQWEVHTLMADRDGFPTDRQTLFSYDLIVFGEFPRRFLEKGQEWIRDFVAQRGGGLVMIDGRRGHLSDFEGTAIGALFPVDWKADPGRPSALRLTDVGARRTMLSLAAEPDKNHEIWASLPVPRWMASTRALPGSEVLLEAVVGDRRIPALVFRRFGAGRVLYAGFDESWRWRYKVADLHHQRYWNQVVREIIEPPFTVRDDRVSFHVGKVVYGPDETVDLRVRAGEGQAQVDASICRDGEKVATVSLAPDENGAGLFQGQAGPLPVGSYEARVGAEGRLKIGFKVQPREVGELAELSVNEDLLRQMAAQSGGEFLREEQIGELPGRLEPLSRERIFESDTALWQSWGWFLPLVALLAVEWAIRKWKGML